MYSRTDLKTQKFVGLLDRKDANTARPLEGLKIVDVGCGGGLVCEVFNVLEYVVSSF